MCFLLFNENNKLLAQSIMQQFKRNLNSKRTVKTTDLYMYRNITTPGVLVECGYLSNPTERNQLQTKKYQQQLSSSITEGIINYLKKRNKIKYVI